MSMVALNTRHVELVVKEDLEGENALSLDDVVKFQGSRWLHEFLMPSTYFQAQLGNVLTSS